MSQAAATEALAVAVALLTPRLLLAVARLLQMVWQVVPVLLPLRLPLLWLQKPLLVSDTCVTALRRLRGSFDTSARLKR